MIAGAAVLIVLAGLLGWRTLQARKARDARVRVIPQIQELTRSPRSLEADAARAANRDPGAGRSEAGAKRLAAS